MVLKATIPGDLPLFITTDINRMHAEVSLERDLVFQTSNRVDCRVEGRRGKPQCLERLILPLHEYNVSGQGTLLLFGHRPI